MVKKLDLTTNEKGEITSPTYVEIVAKINEIIEGIIVGKAIYDGDIKLDELVREIDA